MKVASEEADRGDGEGTEELPAVRSALGGVHLKAGWGAGGLIVDTDFLLPEVLGVVWPDVESSWKEFFNLSVFFVRFAQRSPQALQSVLGPVGPFRHSGESTRPHV